MTQPIAPTTSVGQLVTNHDNKIAGLNLDPSDTARLDQDAARVTEELDDFGVDLADPTVARTILALATVIEARVVGDLLTDGSIDPREQEDTALDAISDVLVGAAESVARQAA